MILLHVRYQYTNLIIYFLMEALRPLEVVLVADSIVESLTPTGFNSNESIRTMSPLNSTTSATEFTKILPSSPDIRSSSSLISIPTSRSSEEKQPETIFATVSVTVQQTVSVVSSHSITVPMTMTEVKLSTTMITETKISPTTLIPNIKRPLLSATNDAKGPFFSREASKGILIYAILNAAVIFLNFNL